MRSESSSAFSPNSILKPLALFALQLGAPALAAPGARRALLRDRDSLDRTPLAKARGQTAHAFNESQALMSASTITPITTAPGVAGRQLLASTSTFTQPLWHGEDPRVTLENGYYYTVWSIGSQRVMCKSTSLVDRSSCQETPPGFPLFAPRYIGTLNGETYNAWVSIDGNVWMNPEADPYDSMDAWSMVKSIPFSGWSIDFEMFQNPQPGPYQGQYYLAWAGAASPSSSFGFESVYIAQILSLRAGEPTLSTYDNTDANKVAHYNFDWSDVIKEAPGAMLQGADVSLAYSGNGAHTDDYGLGLAILQHSQDPSVGTSWLDHNQGECDGDVVNGPEFAQTDRVFGPGVARQTTSLDGTQDWMMYASKTWSTYNRGAGTPGQQDNNEEYHRQIWTQPLNWRSVVCSGQTYAIPSFGTPVAPGTVMPLPSGDTGIVPGPRQIEAETMVPYGFVMGSSIQNLPRINGDTDVITNEGSQFSGTAKMSYIDVLSFDQPQSPQQSGLVWNNAPQAQTLEVAHASVSDANYDLLINGGLVTTLSLPATGDSDQFAISSFAVDIPAGAQIQLNFQLGKNAAADLDYIALA